MVIKWYSMKKYKLLRNDIAPLCPFESGEWPLYRIRALRSFGVVKEGDLGGWIRTEDNLSHSGLCWVADGGRVCDFADACDDAWVGPGVTVRDNARVIGASRLEGKVLLCDDARVIDSILKHEVVVGDRGKVVRSTLGGSIQVEGDGQVFGQRWEEGGARIWFDSSKEDFLVIGPYGSPVPWWVTVLKKGEVAIGDLFRGDFNEMEYFLDKRYNECIFGKYGPFAEAVDQIKMYLGLL